jgi:F-type H+-transporting ATPase subunit alpha
VLAIFAVTNGLMDSVPVRDIRRFETEMREYVRTRHRGLIDSMSETGDFPKDAEGDPDTSELEAAIKEFLEMFEPTE